MPGALHELMKEPNNQSMFEAILLFTSGAKMELGELPLFKYASNRALWRKRKFWLFVLALSLFVSLLVALRRNKTNVFFFWPSLLALAKRFR